MRLTAISELLNNDATDHCSTYNAGKRNCRSNRSADCWGSPKRVTPYCAHYTTDYSPRRSRNEKPSSSTESCAYRVRLRIGRRNRNQRDRCGRKEQCFAHEFSIPKLIATILYLIGRRGCIK